VMGSKNLKLVAARGTMDLKIAHPREALEFDKRFIDQISSAKVNQTQGALGTPFIWGATNSWGGVRSRNFQLNQCEYADDIEPERLDEIAALPSRTVLIAMVLGGFNAPIQGLAGALSGILSKLVRTVDAVRESRAKTEQ